MPFGLPSPVGPSQPVRAWQSWLGEQLPLLPVVASNRADACC